MKRFLAAAFVLLIGLSASASGTFAGVMPEGGDTFDVQYPYEAPEIGYNQTFLQLCQYLAT